MEADNIFKVAEELGLTTSEYMWVVTKSVVAETLDESEEEEEDRNELEILEYKKFMGRYPKGILGKCHTNC